MPYKNVADRRAAALARYYRNKPKWIAEVKAYYERNKARILARAQARYQSDPGYRAKIIDRAREHGVSRNRFANLKEWRKANPDKFREQSRRRRAREMSAETGPVDIAKVLRLANGLCGICRKPFDLFGVEIDHIVPLARGGSHTQGNLQATHARCNRLKGAKTA